MVNTARVSRRSLHFDSWADLKREIERLVAKEHAGTLRGSGNWTLGQTLGHLGTWADYAFEPCPLRPLWIVRMVVRTQKRKFIEGPMKAGVRIPGVKGGTLGTEPRSLEDGLAHCVRAWERLASQAPTQRNVLFGEMSAEDWRRLNLRHAELHLGCFAT